MEFYLNTISYESERWKSCVLVLWVKINERDCLFDYDNAFVIFKCLNEFIVSDEVFV